jgi:hypothetical protein
VADEKYFYHIFIYSFLPCIAPFARFSGI